MSKKEVVRRLSRSKSCSRKRHESWEDEDARELRARHHQRRARNERYR